jgi:hypothetical protein
VIVGRKSARQAYHEVISLWTARPIGYSEGFGGIAMYRVVYWSGVTLFVVWSVFSAVSALTGF